MLTHKKQPASGIDAAGTHQGAVSREHLDYYLDEFTFRCNRRNSKTRGKLFYWLLQQAVAVETVPYKAMVKCYASGHERRNWWLPASSKYPTFADILELSRWDHRVAGDPSE